MHEGYPYKTKPSTGNHFIFICLKTPKYHKQCVITTDAEYISSQVSSKNNCHKINFPDTAHPTPILMNVEALHHHHHSYFFP